jgi:hypothetical protein
MTLDDGTDDGRRVNVRQAIEDGVERTEIMDGNRWRLMLPNEAFMPALRLPQIETDWVS